MNINDFLNYKVLGITHVPYISGIKFYREAYMAFAPVGDFKYHQVKIVDHDVIHRCRPGDVLRIMRGISGSGDGGGGGLWGRGGENERNQRLSVQGFKITLEFTSLDSNGASAIAPPSLPEGYANGGNVEPSAPLNNDTDPDSTDALLPRAPDADELPPPSYEDAVKKPGEYYV